jgi:hypothetical protein
MADSTSSQHQTEPTNQPTNHGMLTITNHQPQVNEILANVREILKAPYHLSIEVALPARNAADHCDKAQFASPYLFDQCHVSVVARDLALLSHTVVASASGSDASSVSYVWHRWCCIAVLE